MTIRNAARKLDREFAALEAVLDCQAGISPDLAARRERIDWSTTAVWIGSQADYDLAQARLRRERKAPKAV